ncbi:MAG: hemerythrin domain-containing protein [Planctomycetes bacterium]|nr:hemerythrin domain-containing protein [Planctomycetota bacterium]
MTEEEIIRRNIDSIKQALWEHQEIIKTVDDITEDLAQGAAYVISHAYDMAEKQDVLLQQLKNHLSVEDQQIYPLLCQHEDAVVRISAEILSKEMLALSPLILQWGESWNAERMTTEIEVFLDETRRVFKLLNNRIAREEKELYSLL